MKKKVKENKRLFFSKSTWETDAKKQFAIQEIKVRSPFQFVFSVSFIFNKVPLDEDSIVIKTKKGRHSFFQKKRTRSMDPSAPDVSHSEV